MSGTKWTNAGWTRSNPDKVVQSVNVKIIPAYSYPSLNMPITNDFYYRFNLSGSISNEIHKGDTYLVSSFQYLWKNAGQHNLVANGVGYFDDSSDTSISYNGQKIGYLTAKRLDDGETDIYFHATTDLKSVTPITFSFNMHDQGGFTLNNAQNPYKDFSKFPPLPDKYYIVTPTNLTELTWNKDPKMIPYTPPEILDGAADGQLSFWGYNYSTTSSDHSTHLQYKLYSQQPFNLQNVGASITAWPLYGQLHYFLTNADGQLTNDNVQINRSTFPVDKWESGIKKIHLPDYTSSADAWKETPKNTISVAIQDDHNLIITYNTKDSDLKLTPAEVERGVKQSYLYNIQDPEHKEQILQQNLNYYKNRNWTIQGGAVTLNLPFDNSKPQLYTYSNITPGQTPTVKKVYSSLNNSSFNAELYKTTNVQYIDDTTGNTVAKDSLTGVQDQTTSYKVNVPKGYVLSKNQPTSDKYTWSADKSNINYTFDKDQKVNDANPIIIHLTHEQKQVNGQEEAKRTIKYVYGADDKGVTAHPDVPQSITFSGTQDSVTGKLSDLKPSGQWDQVVSPDIKGYTPDLKVVQSETPNPNENKTVTVHYLANDENAKLRVIDDHTGLELQGYDEKISGKFDAAISFKTNPNDVAKQLENKGYKVVSNDWKDGSKYQDGKNVFTIHVDHTTSQQTETHPQTRTIHYVDGKGNKMSDDVVQKSNFTRTGTKDNVTGQIDWKDWTTNDKYQEVASPVHDGYTPDKAKIDAVTPVYGQNQDQTVVYHRNGQGAEITYVDDTTGKVLKHEQAQGKYNDKIVFNSNVPDTIKGYQDQGYVLVSNDFKDQNYSSDNTKNKFTVHFKHGTKQVTRDKNVSQNIDYQIKENSSTHSVNHYKAPDLKFTQSGVQDNVTKQITWNGSVKDQQFKAVNTPTIKGYTPDIKQVPTTNIHVDSSNWNQDQNVKKTVTYTPDQETVKVIAKDRDTNKILNQSQLTGTYGSEYHTTAPKITGYHLVKSSANASGKFDTNNADVIYLYAKDTPTDSNETTGTPKSDNTSIFQQNLDKQDTKDLPEMSEANMAVTTLAGLGLLTLTGLVPVIKRKIRN